MMNTYRDYEICAWNFMIGMAALLVLLIQIFLIWPEIRKEEKEAEPMAAEPVLLEFVDVFGNSYTVKIQEEAEKHSYDVAGFRRDGQYMQYTDIDYRVRQGIDVSYHQGEIDWEKVKACGYEFAIIRIGYRGYGAEGRLCQDPQFENNYNGARSVGIDVGVYFFAQAVNEREAKEEAEFVLDILDNRELQCPVVYDPESILDAPARTDNVTGEQFTANTMLFCSIIKENGYEPMVYSNMLWEAYKFDMRQIQEYPVWYADYEPKPQTPYMFEYWQYSDSGQVDGVQGVCDLDIQIIPRGSYGERR